MGPVDGIDCPQSHRKRKFQVIETISQGMKDLLSSPDSINPQDQDEPRIGLFDIRWSLDQKMRELESATQKCKRRRLNFEANIFSELSGDFVREILTEIEKSEAEDVEMSWEVKK